MALPGRSVAVLADRWREPAALPATMTFAQQMKTPVFIFIS
jgi:hypothetical protein